MPHNNNIEPIEPSGVLIIDKESGPTSHDIINLVRRKLGIKRVGHTGTLDPMATGVLVVLVGRAAKAAEYLVSDRKKYRAVMRLGITTDTQDSTGKILTSYEGALPSLDRIKSVCDDFVGRSEQVPPMYSALKVGGKKLVDLAREGKEIDRAPRPIEIYSIDIEGPTGDGGTDFLLEAEVSSGTYIRTLCSDIGDKLGVGAVMAGLRRLETGGFGLEESISTEELRSMEKDEIIDRLIPTEALFSALEKVKLPAFYEKLFRSGCEIYQKKIKTSFEVGTRLAIYSEDGEFFALGEVADYEAGTAIKSVKILKL